MPIELSGLVCDRTAEERQNHSPQPNSAEPKTIDQYSVPFRFLSRHLLVSMTPHLVIFWRCRAEMCVAVHDFDQNSHPTSSHPGLLFSSGQDACLRLASP